MVKRLGAWGLVACVFAALILYVVSLYFSESAKEHELCVNRCKKAYFEKIEAEVSYTSKEVIVCRCHKNGDTIGLCISDTYSIMSPCSPEM